MDPPSPYYFDDENVLRHYQTDITVDTEAVLKGDLGPEVLDFIFGEVQGRMVRDLGMVRRAIPSADDPAHCDIFCTEGWLEAERLLVFVTNKRRGQAGIWSRGLCISSGLNVGSMLPYIAKAKEASFGVVVLNANANSVQLPLEGGELAAFVAAQEKEEAERAAAAKAEATAAAAAQVAEKLSTIDIEEESGGPGGAAAAPAQPAAAVPENPKHANLKTRHLLDTGGVVLLERPRPPATKKHPIATSSTPEEHMATVWETVLKPAAARSISFLCFDEGAALVANLLQTNPAETFLPPSQAAEGGGGGGGAPVGRVSSVVLIEPFHSRSAPRSPELETFLGTRSLCIEREASAGYEGGVPASWVYALHNTGPGALQFTYEGNGGGGGEREQASNLAITIGDTMDSAMAFLVRSCVDHTPALGNEFLLKTALKHKATAVPFIAPSASGDGGGGAGAGADEPAIVKHRSFRKMVSDGFKKLSRKGSSSTAGGGSAGEAAAPPPAPVVEQLSLDNFELLQVVGKGAFGKVFLVQRKSQGKGKHAAEGTDRRIFAMKVLLKSHIYQKKQVEHTKTERTILQTVDHPFLVRLRYAFQTSKKLYMLMDYYAGGSLFYHLMKQKRFSFEQANFYAAELFLAMHHLHTLSIAYRDVKLENILMDKVRQQPTWCSRLAPRSAASLPSCPRLWNAPDPHPRPAFAPPPRSLLGALACLARRTGMCT